MKTVIVYRSESEHGRPVEEFLHDFTRQTGKTIETVNPDDRAGQAFIEAHSVMQYPTVVAMDNDGRTLQMWEGLPLPRITEVSYYVE